MNVFFLMILVLIELLLAKKRRHDKLLKDKLKDKLRKDKLLKRQTPEKTNS